MTQNRLIFLDTETTGVGPDDRLCQLAYKSDMETYEGLFNPSRPIGLMAMSVTHITNDMVADKPTFHGSKAWEELVSHETADYILVAHNAKFDADMLAKEDIVWPTNRIIDTLKVVRFIDSGDMEAHNLQYCRYYFNLNVDLGELAPHDALADIIVLEALYNHLSTTLLVEDMLKISQQPTLLKKIPFGNKHRGVLIADVAKSDPSYLVWLLGEKQKSPEGEEDWIFTLNYYLTK